MHPFVYLSTPEKLCDESGTLATIDASARTKPDVTQTIGRQLGFPDYARPNWDSFESCLRDLSWLQPKRVMIYHAAMPLADEADRKTYLSVLRDATHAWAKDPAHDFVVGFHPDARPDVERLLGG